MLFEDIAGVKGGRVVVKDSKTRDTTTTQIDVNGFSVTVAIDQSRFGTIYRIWSISGVPTAKIDTNLGWNSLDRLKKEALVLVDKWGERKGGRKWNPEWDKSIEAWGVRGTSGASWRKVFKNRAEYEKWLDQNYPNISVRGTKVIDSKTKDSKTRDEKVVTVKNDDGDLWDISIIDGTHLKMRLHGDTGWGWALHFNEVGDDIIRELKAKGLVKGNFFVTDNRTKDEEVVEDNKTGATIFECMECGKKFKKKLGPNTFEVQCPKCGGYDIDVTFYDSKTRDHWYTHSRKGRYTIYEGAGTDGGRWKVEGKGETRIFRSLEDAEDHVRLSGDSKTRDDDFERGSNKERTERAIKVLSQGKTIEGMSIEEARQWLDIMSRKTELSKDTNGYIAFYKGKRAEVYANTKYEAQKKAAQILGAKNSYDVNIELAEKNGESIVHKATDSLYKGQKVTAIKSEEGLREGETYTVIRGEKPITQSSEAEIKTVYVLQDSSGNLVTVSGCEDLFYRTEDSADTFTKGEALKVKIGEIQKNMDAARKMGYDTAQYQKEIDKLQEDSKTKDEGVSLQTYRGKTFGITKKNGMFEAIFLFDENHIKAPSEQEVINKAKAKIDQFFKNRIGDKKTKDNKRKRVKTFADGETRGDITISNGSIIKAGKKVGRADQFLKHGYHPMIEVIINGKRVKELEIDTPNIVDKVFEIVKAYTKDSIIPEELFGEIIEEIERITNPDYTEYEGKDVRFDYGDNSVWIRSGGSVEGSPSSKVARIKQIVSKMTTDLKTKDATKEEVLQKATGMNAGQRQDFRNKIDILLDKAEKLRKAGKGNSPEYKKLQQEAMVLMRG